MSAEENKAIQRAWLNAINSELESGSMDQANNIVAPTFVAHHAGAPGPLDFAGQKQFAQMFFTAFPGGHISVEDVVSEGDKVVARWTFHGTHRGELMGVPPTGKAVTMAGIEINRIANGKIVEHWVAEDVLGVLQQLGAAPAPGQAMA